MHRLSTPPSPAVLAHLRASNRVGATYVGITAAATAVGVWLSLQPGSAVWLLGQVVLAACFVEWFVLLHECGHGTLFRDRRANVVTGHVAGVAALIPFESWRRIHGRHHKWTGWQDLDPTTAVLTPRPLRRLERAVVNLCWRLWIPLFAAAYRLNNFWNVSRLLRLFTAPATRAHVAVSVVATAGVYVTVVIVLGPATTARLILLSLSLSFIAQDILIVSQHTHVPMGLSHGQAVEPYPTLAQEPFTRSLRLPAWLSRALLHFDAHELHHMYPFVPGYELHAVPYTPAHEVPWTRWIPAARAIPGEQLFFQNRDETGFDL